MGENDAGDQLNHGYGPLTCKVIECSTLMQEYGRILCNGSNYCNFINALYHGDGILHDNYELTLTQRIDTHVNMGYLIFEHDDIFPKGTKLRREYMDIQRMNSH